MVRLKGISLAAGALDLFFGLSLCHFVQFIFGYYFALRAVVTLQVGQPGTLWKGLIPWVMGMFGNFVYTLPLAFFLYFLPEAIWGWSLGKKMLSLTIKGQLKDRIFRYLLKTTAAWGMTLALIIGSWQLLVCFLAAGLIILMFRLQDRLTRTELIVQA